MRWPSTTTASSPSWPWSQQPRRVGQAGPSRPTLGLCSIACSTWSAQRWMWIFVVPRQGDGDNGTALVLDPPDGRALVGPPRSRRGLVRRTTVVAESGAHDDQHSSSASMAGRHPVTHSDHRPSSLRRCRHDPSAELPVGRRRDLVPMRCRSARISVDRRARARRCPCRRSATRRGGRPGRSRNVLLPRRTQWRRYFRSTLAHNTIEVGGQDQSTSGGPFLWTRHAQSSCWDWTVTRTGALTAWSAEHDGYRALNPPLRHRRSVELHSRLRRLEIVDCLETTGRHAFQAGVAPGPRPRCPS